VTFDAFRGFFGGPQPGTGVALAALGLDGFPFLRDFARDVGGGLFHDGMLSVASRREQVAILDDWRRALPDGARHFATSGLGDLFLITTDGTIHWVDTQRAELARLDVAPDRFFDWLAEPPQRNTYLGEKLWDQRFAVLEADEVLGFAPALVLGGPVDWGNLEKVKLREHLALLAALHFA
jgi:hypothetical protein